MMRHPIPVSLSRKVLPRLLTFLNSDYKRHFSETQIQYAQNIAETGTKLEKGVLSWCLQNAVPLQQATKDWIIVSYEQLVLNPEPVIDLIAREMDLPFPQKMIDRLRVPSETTWQSDHKTKEVLNGILDKSKNKYLIERWKSKISDEEEKSLMSILDVFNINAYSAGSPLPKADFWIAPK